MTTKTNLTIYQGETYSVSFTWQEPDGTPIDLSAYTARMQIRRNYADADRSEPVLDITDADSITLDDEGNILITVTDDVTEAIAAAHGYVYDLELAHDGVVTKLLAGTVNVLPEVTRG